MSEKEKDWKTIPIYKDSGLAARENNELEVFQASNAANKACAEAIEKTISDNWDGIRLKDGCVQPIMGQFGEQRLMFVLANALQLHATDGRFSRDNLAWAQMVQIEPTATEDPAERRYSWDIHSHPVKLDEFAVQTRKALEEIAIRETPVYQEPYQYAVDNGETIPFWDSHSCNMECRNAIEDAIDKHFDGFHLEGNAPESVLKKFGMDRTMYVIANSIQLLRDDGRISQHNVQWATKVPVPHGNEQDDSLRRDFLVRSHPGLFNLFAKITRDQVLKLQKRQLEQKMGKEKEQRPSILKQLGKPLSRSNGNHTPARKKEQMI